MSSGKFRYMVVSHWLRKDGGEKLERGYAKTSSLSAELPVANKIGACQQSARPPPIPPLLELSWTTNHTRWVSRCFPTDTEVNIWSVPYQLMFSIKDSSLTTITDKDASRRAE